MQDASTPQLPRVALSHGDFNGIGYEIMLKTFADARMFEMLTPVLYGQSKAFAYLYDNSLVSFLKKHQTIFHRGYTILYPTSNV